MKLEHDFNVHAPVEQAWDILLDVERVAPCLPGAALDGGGGPEYSGTMTVKLGPVTTRYRGTVRIEDADEPARRAVLRAQGRDARGDGTAAAVITAWLQPAGDGTRVRVETDLAVSGPAAQFGRGVMQDVSARLMREFADCLAEELGGGSAVALTSSAGNGGGVAAASTIAYEETEVGRLPVGPAGDAALAAARPPARERRSAEVLDLGAASRAAIAKRAVPAVAVLAAAVAAAAYLRRRR
jgi:carbon monoxide dehydrogenase subunit G